MSKQELSEFFFELDSEMDDRLEELGEFEGHSAGSAALAQVYIEYLEETGIIADCILCPYEDVDGRNRCKISAYAISADETRLDLFVASNVLGKLESLSTGE